MRTLFCTDDWLGRHPNVCLILLAVGICLAGAL